MKKIFLLYSLSSILTLSSCNKFLDLEPQSDPTVASFYKTESDIRNAVNGCYAALQSNRQYAGHFITLMEVRSDNISDNNSGGNAGRDYNIDRFIAGADNIAILQAWQSIYNAIYRANAALANLDVVPGQSTRNQYEGELRFLRALNYFNAVRLWGDIPLVLQPVEPEDAYALIRNDQSEVMEAIIDDLEVAKDLLPPAFGGDDLGRATNGAAKTLLAKVLLTIGEYGQASSILKEVIDSKHYELLPVIDSVFSVNNKMNREIIFAVRYNKSVVDEGHPILTYFDGPVLDPLLLNGYPPDDARRPLLNTTSVNTRRPVNKFYDIHDLNTNNVGNDFPLLRFADVLLMYAEASNEDNYQLVGDARTALDSVRIRATGTPFNDVELADQDLFRSAVADERRLELPLECHRWFDLIRTDRAVEVMQGVNLQIERWQYLYPIPLTEVQIVNDPERFPQNLNY
ncbi:RagB/SusD family nutrient uptake outer membrane protein [Sphingobacterium haloxyli]|uniref:RagB/SusD family nutrient uptake outer membrane protein n=1 Tax=Sphingobacterium haloxyli TaxID=2100533 RepID=A0A2S9J4V2_9SPHI|nr:RagB/SusD family nutrient uptake outer membrane protein [Sphingobacterium haloxyli]PRD47782.1 RagB/SusD family nutrient uptake outer membrane protein [Sphingobacterium haloxyli]